MVRRNSFEGSAPQGWKSSREFVMESSSATMWFDKVGWARTPFDRKDCIHVASEDEAGRRIELALSPQGGPQPAWEALFTSGVRTS